MFFTIALLVAALVPTVRDSWLLFPAHPACCSFGRSIPGSGYDLRIERIGIRSATFTISITLLVAGYLKRAIHLFDLAMNICHLWLYKIPTEKIKASINAVYAWPIVGIILSNILLIQYLLVHSLVDLFSSAFWVVQNLLVAAVTSAKVHVKSVS